MVHHGWWSFRMMLSLNEGIGCGRSETVKPPEQSQGIATDVVPVADAVDAVLVEHRRILRQVTPPAVGVGGEGTPFPWNWSRLRSQKSSQGLRLTWEKRGKKEGNLEKWLLRGKNEGNLVVEVCLFTSLEKLRANLEKQHDFSSDSYAAIQYCWFKGPSYKAWTGCKLWLLACQPQLFPLQCWLVKHCLIIKHLWSINHWISPLTRCYLQSISQQRRCEWGIGSPWWRLAPTPSPCSRSSSWTHEPNSGHSWWTRTNNHEKSWLIMVTS